MVDVIKAVRPFMLSIALMLVVLLPLGLTDWSKPIRFAVGWVLGAGALYAARWIATRAGWLPKKEGRSA